MEKIIPAIPNNFDEMIKFLNEAFPDGSFLNAVQNDIVVEWANKAIIDLIRKRIIKPAINHPYNLLLRRISNSQKIDFTDFLVESSYLTQKEMDSLMVGFDSNAGAEEKIKQFF